MPFTTSGGIRIHYEMTGSGPPLVLLHGWSASMETNFRGFGWVDALAPHYRLLMVDFRGHGRSEKPLRRAAYSVAKMGGDVLAAMEAAAIERAGILAYSTGAEVALELLANQPGRFGPAVLGGTGAEFHFGWGRRSLPEDGLRRPFFDWFPPRRVGRLARWALNNPLALGACFRALYDGRPPVDLERAATIRSPVLVVVGTRDGFGRSAQRLVDAIPGARLAAISGRNHASTIGDRRFKQAALQFFAAHM